VDLAPDIAEQALDRRVHVLVRRLERAAGRDPRQRRVDLRQLALA
jgi:hypothetical protein